MSTLRERAERALGYTCPYGPDSQAARNIERMTRFVEDEMIAFARNVIVACGALPDAHGRSGNGDWTIEGAVYRDAIRALDPAELVRRYMEGGR